MELLKQTENLHNLIFRKPGKKKLYSLLVAPIRFLVKVGYIISHAMLANKKIVFQ